MRPDPFGDPLRDGCDRMLLRRQFYRWPCAGDQGTGLQQEEFASGERELDVERVGGGQALKLSQERNYPIQGLRSNSVAVLPMDESMQTLATTAGDRSRITA